MASVIVDIPKFFKGGISDPKSAIKDFFARPEFIGTISTTGAYASINPWTEYLNSTPVADKTKNYAYIRGTLHVRFYLTPQPFVSGRMLIAYNPGGNRDELVNYRGDPTSMSNLPHIILDPGLTCDKTMVIPFHCRTRYFKLLDRDYDELGLLSFIRLTDFSNVNTGTAVNLSIRMTAWMSDAELLISTFQNQSSGYVSEYNPSKPVSTTATAISKAAGNLSSLPVIGGLMTGVQKGSQMIGGIANLFGFTRPNSVVDNVFVVNRLTSSLSNTSGGDSAINITTDPKFGKSIDSSMITGHNEDQLIIASIASRYSLLALDTWTSADALGTKLLQFPVTPSIVDSIVTPVHLTNCAYASLPFGYWRGTMRYLFSLVKTPYHRGKLRISWSLGDTDPNDGSLNIGYAVLWDISETSEIEIKVPFLSEKYWIPVKQIDKTETNMALFNGKITITVLDTLTGPIDTASIEIHTWISADLDIQYAIPTTAAINRLVVKPCTIDTPRTYTNTVPSFVDTTGNPTNDSTTIAVITENQSSVTIAGINLDNDDACKMTIGESIVSFRSLLKRYYGSRLEVVPYNDAIFIRQFPDAPGSYRTTGNAQVNGNASQSLITWLAPAFLGASGSIRHKYQFSSTSTAGAVLTTNMGAVYDVMLRDTKLFGVDPRLMQSYMSQGVGAGHALAYKGLSILEVEIPQYSQYLYNPTALLANSTDTVHVYPTSGVWLYATDAYKSTVGTYTTIQYVAGGDDFTFHYYVGPPEMHRKEPTY